MEPLDLPPAGSEALCPTPKSSLSFLTPSSNGSELPTQGWSCSAQGQYHSLAIIQELLF